jgi:hypothetical protein
MLDIEWPAVALDKVDVDLGFLGIRQGYDDRLESFQGECEVAHSMFQMFEGDVESESVSELALRE